jgi:APA family basic amino acid/polyamine antiporter
VAGAALLAAGPALLAGSPAPLRAVLESGSLARLAPAVRVGAAVASLGVLLSLLAGVSRTMFAMAAAGDLPGRLAAVHPRTRVPHVAELLAGAVVCAIVAAADIRGAIGFSSFCVLGYYAVANVSALTLGGGYRAIVAVLGAAGCVALALSLPLRSVVEGTAVLAAGLGLYVLRRRA